MSSRDRRVGLAQDVEHELGLLDRARRTRPGRRRSSTARPCRGAAGARRACAPRSSVASGALVAARRRQQRVDARRHGTAGRRPCAGPARPGTRRRSSPPRGAGGRWSARRTAPPRRARGRSPAGRRGARSRAASRSGRERRSSRNEPRRFCSTSSLASSTATSVSEATAARCRNSSPRAAASPSAPRAAARRRRPRRPRRSAPRRATPGGHLRRAVLDALGDVAPQRHRVGRRAPRDGGRGAEPRDRRSPPAPPAAPAASSATRSRPSPPSTASTICRWTARRRSTSEPASGGVEDWLPSRVRPRGGGRAVRPAPPRYAVVCARLAQAVAAAGVGVGLEGLLAGLAGADRGRPPRPAGRTPCRRRSSRCGRA